MDQSARGVPRPSSGTSCAPCQAGTAPVESPCQTLEKETIMLVNQERNTDISEQERKKYAFDTHMDSVPVNVSYSDLEERDGTHFV